MAFCWVVVRLVNLISNHTHTHTRTLVHAHGARFSGLRHCGHVTATSRQLRQNASTAELRRRQASVVAILSLPTFQLKPFTN